MAAGRGTPAGMGSLLDERERAAPPAAAAPPAGPAFLAEWNQILRQPPAQALRGARDWFTDHPTHRTRNRRLSGVLAAALAVAAGAGVWALIPRSQPDYLEDPLDDVLDYTLLTSDFNSLPVKDRLKLIRDLVERLRGMQGGDSVLMASFAAGIAGSAREQLEENISRLSLDVADTYATRYIEMMGEATTQAERARAIERTYLEFVREMEEIAGQANDASDEERLADAKRQAQRGEERIRRLNAGERGDDRAAGIFTVLNDRVGSRSEPAQRARITVMMRDMSRHFRGNGPR
jgi:hypothetical protein